MSSVEPIANMGQRAPGIYEKMLIISIFSVFGTIIRISILELRPIIPVIAYPQILGCFIMGFAIKARMLVNSDLLILGLVTGLCGSITSFSSFALAVFAAFQNSAWDGFILIILIHGMSFSSFQAGCLLSDCVKDLDFNLKINPKCLYISGIMVAAALVIWGLLDPNRFQLPVASFAGTIGSILRYNLGLLFNRPNKTFPFGTFYANMLATGGIALATVFSSQENCKWMYIFAIGFCGCLSTISTYILELSSFENPLIALRYASASTIIGILLVFIIRGSFLLSGNTSFKCI